VLPQQAVTIGKGKGNSFMVQQISPEENSVVVLLRPKGEDCTFRFVVDMGHSVQLRRHPARSIISLRDDLAAHR
jgi:hypothetical protein